MFLCTFDEVLPSHEAMPGITFRDLLGARSSPEIAKLQMFLHFFERIGSSPLYGQIKIDRVVGVELSESEWLNSAQPLLPLDMEQPKVGFETRPDLAHADFANMMIGGGVLCGGCVQEEIRFAICPELCLAMLVCPCMLETEAIQITGAEQFSAYKGYAHTLRYGGDHIDTAEKGPEGSLFTSVLAMDALDLRSQDSSLAAQLESKNMLRELNKSHAAFTPVDANSLQEFEVVATGNWGCGAFGGCAPLKALVQWASASQCKRRICYFPFMEDFGPELERLARRCVQTSTSVGQLLQVLWDLQPPPQMNTGREEDAAHVGTKRPPPLELAQEDIHPKKLLATVTARLFPQH